MIAGCVSCGDQIHWSGGTRRPRLPPWVRRRPNTIRPVYLGLERIEYTPEEVHPLAGSGGGYDWWSAFSRAVSSGTPRRPGVGQAKICATTGARAGSRIRRALVRPWAAFTATG